jgi:RND family efflux transporter MFP subunit
MSSNQPILSSSSDPNQDVEHLGTQSASAGNVLESGTTASIPPDVDFSERPRRRKTWLWSILTLLLLGGGGFGAWQLLGNRKALPPQMPPTPVKVQTIESTQLQSSSEFVGTLEAQERVSLQPQIQGRIERILVSSGDRVSAGTPIVSLSLDQTQANVVSALALVNSNEAAVATAQAQLEARQADLAKAAADVDLQQTQYDRTQSLVSAGAQARQQLDIAQNNLTSALATLTAAEKQVNAAQAGVNQALSNVEQAQAQVASTQINLNQKQVVAPMDGVVGDFSVKAGDYVNVGQTLTSLIKNDVLDMRIAVPAINGTQLRPGLRVELIDANTGQQLTRGSLDFISPQVDVNAQSILVKARFSNANGRLRDGQYVRARIIWNQQAGMLIPVQAVNRMGGQNFVYVVEENSSQQPPQFVVQLKPVKLGEVQNDQYPILEGVKEGDRIAVSNILKLRDGVPIQPEP